MAKRSIAGPALLFGGGVLTIGAAWWALRASKQTTSVIKNVTSGAAPPPGTTLDIGPAGYPTVKVRATGYWPYQAGLSAAERKMEGGVTDRKGAPLHTLEMHQADPVKHPYVSVAGDYEIWPYGQRIIIDAWPNAIFRVVDTGGHFHGLGKLYRVAGYEPLDFAVDSSKTVVPKLVSAQIVRGDNFEGGKLVAASGFKGQSVTVAGIESALSIVEGRTAADYEALARAVESNCGGCTREEAVAAAWAIRNRADEQCETVLSLLAPSGVYGAPYRTGGFASTRRVPTDWSRAIAAEVLDAHGVDDPTGNAIDFWTPSKQDQLYQLGGVYRAAVQGGDMERARRYECYADYDTEDDVRLKHARDGLKPVSIVGSVELLGRSL